MDKGANQWSVLGALTFQVALDPVAHNLTSTGSLAVHLGLPGPFRWLPTESVIPTGRPSPAEWELGRHTTRVHREETLCDGAAEGVCA